MAIAVAATQGNTANSSINTRFNTPNVSSDIMPNPIWNKPRRNIVTRGNLGNGGKEEVSLRVISKISEGSQEYQRQREWLRNFPRQALVYNVSDLLPGLAERLRQRTHNSPKTGSTPVPWINNQLPSIIHRFF